MTDNIAHFGNETIRCWVLTDGKAGDEGQCLGVAERLGIIPERRITAPRAPWVWAMPWGPADPKEHPTAADSPFAPPFPDLLIASGRRAVAPMRAIRKASKGRTFTLFLKDPRTGTGTADLIWVPEHDTLRGDNVLVTPASPHRLSPERLAASRAHPPAFVTALKRPRIAVLTGGRSRHHPWPPEDDARFAQALEDVARTDAALMGTFSRRTHDSLRHAVSGVFARHGGFLWDGAGENPYLALLAHADAIIASADSVNMIDEACATGVPVHVFEPTGGHKKIERHLETLKKAAAVRTLGAPLAFGPVTPLDSTGRIADALAKAYALHSKTFRPGQGPNP